MKKKLQTQQIADFSLGVSFEDIGEENIDQLKRHLLDSLSSLFHATQKPTIRKLVNQLEFLADGGKCSVPLLKGLPFDRAAQLYTALIRYPDFMDNFMGKEATCHPSDNIGSLLAVSQYRKTSGKDFLTAMAIAYQLECRLVQEIPVMKEGIDHTLLLDFSLSAGIARLIGLTADQAAHALAIAGCAISPTVTSRASYTYEWKGLASSMDALDCVNVAFMAQQGMTGPISIFEGPKGFKEIFDMDLDYDWQKENFALIPKCVLKAFNAEVHSQASLEAIIELRNTHDFAIEAVEKVDITTFLTAFHIIGSGSYGDRKTVHSKEQADHSLFYLAAAALIDGQVYPEQLTPERINSEDVQQLLQKVFVHTGFPLHKPLVIAGILDPYTEAYPDKMKTKVVIHLKSGKTFTCEKEGYHGFFKDPFTWDDTIDKFQRLANGIVDKADQERLIRTIKNLDKEKDIMPLIRLISK